jgi:hypothetical protein
MGVAAGLHMQFARVADGQLEVRTPHDQQPNPDSSDEPSIVLDEMIDGASCEPSPRRLAHGTRPPSFGEISESDGIPLVILD